MNTYILSWEAVYTRTRETSDGYEEVLSQDWKEWKKSFEVGSDDDACEYARQHLSKFWGEYRSPKLMRVVPFPEKDGISE